MDHQNPPDAFPVIRTIGTDAMLVTFADRLGEASNRAALTFRGALERAGWEGVEETSTSLASAFVRFDPRRLGHDALRNRLLDMLARRDWYREPLPPGRRQWRVPCVFGTDLAPQLGQAAAMAGLSEADAIAYLGAVTVRVLTIGFAPGQPFLGPLGPEWHLPRQTSLNPQVPTGALVQAIRQFTLYTNAAPTGWRHVGQTAFRNFQADRQAPFALTPGDEMVFHPVSPAELQQIQANNADGLGGATFKEIPAKEIPAKEIPV